MYIEGDKKKLALMQQLAAKLELERIDEEENSLSQPAAASSLIEGAKEERYAAGRV